ncbi:hypothetical protein [Estrella lausannensis]|uniref:Uncharacterized protein n=1 Tax=Estrella lausannensis TaxID=483423 RepID=A0A0H5DSB8_9BACT|nr:hypothetical protein [Estrella lausannensis]CRX38649.1 Conserved hypothetical protein [Estrella lausannensis]
MTESVNNTQIIQKSEGAGGGDYNDWTLEKLLFLVHTERLKHLEDKSATTLDSLTESQDQVSKLHDLIAKINEITDKDGKINVEKGSEVEKLLKEAEEMGVKIAKTDGEFTDKEKERLVENIRLQIENLNVKNDMMLQEVTRITNERYEMYQLTRMAHKVLDEDKKNKARAIRGG